MRLALSMLVASLAAPVFAGDANPQRDAYMDGKGQIDDLLRRAERGGLSQDRLRRERRRVEQRVALRVSQVATELKPGDLREVSAARAEMNQSVIRSQEYEFFGAEDRPEWGWFPSRRLASTGSHLTVAPDGRSTYSALR
jgi:hypothetical protein